MRLHFFIKVNYKCYVVYEEIMRVNMMKSNEKTTLIRNYSILIWKILLKRHLLIICLIFEKTIAIMRKL
jgi:hypothetical protein